MKLEVYLTLSVFTLRARRSVQYGILRRVKDSDGVARPLLEMRKERSYVPARYTYR